MEVEAEEEEELGHAETYSEYMPTKCEPLIYFAFFTKKIQMRVLKNFGKRGLQAEKGPLFLRGRSTPSDV